MSDKDRFNIKFKLFCGNDKQMLKEFLEIINLHEKSIHPFYNNDKVNIKIEQDKHNN